MSLTKRDIYFYECKDCKNTTRQTFFEDKALIGLCQKCRKKARELEGQESLFTDSPGDKFDKKNY